MNSQEQGITLGQCPVMVRAFQDEPVRLVAKASSGARVEVFRNDESVTLRWPMAYVYEFDPELFTGLEAAWARRDTAVLKSLWKKARPANFVTEETS